MEKKLRPRPNPGSDPARIRHQILELRALPQPLEEARSVQWRIACETERVADLRPGSEFPNKIAGTVLFTNTHFVVLGDDERVTTVRHDGRNFTVGEDVALGWHWCPSSKGEGAEDHVFTATKRRREHHASLDISIVHAEPARNRASGR